MKRLVAITACPTGIAHTLMAAAALKRTAAALGHEIKIETQGSVGTKEPLTASDIAAADAVIIAADIHVNTARFVGKPIHEVTTAKAIRHTKAVIEAATVKAPAVSAAPTPTSLPTTPLPAPAPTAVLKAGKRLVGITSCPTGIAHTFMAAEALQKAARALGHTIKVETQGSVGAKNQLTPEDIAAADAVVIAADTKVDASRFAGKPVYSTSTKDAMHGGKTVIEAALAQSVGGGGSSLTSAVEAAKAKRARARTGPYKHLMTGVSYMLPVVIAGGLAIALAFAIGGIYGGKQTGTLAWALSQIGGGTCRGRSDRR
jgi:PTS system fructose-specific IIC component